MLSARHWWPDLLVLILPLSARSDFVNRVVITDGWFLISSAPLRVCLPVVRVVHYSSRWRFCRIMRRNREATISFVISQSFRHHRVSITERHFERCAYAEGYAEPDDSVLVHNGFRRRHEHGLASALRLFLLLSFFHHCDCHSPPKLMHVLILVDTQTHLPFMTDQSSQPSRCMVLMWSKMIVCPKSLPWSLLTACGQVWSRYVLCVLDLC